MIKTSSTHPLQIAAIATGEGKGRIGVTFCPGKKQLSSFGNHWDRDLQADVAEIAAWGAVAVLSLVEKHEMKAMQVEKLGSVVTDHHMAWFHLPIEDVSVPDIFFENGWPQVSRALHGCLDAGFDVVIHCKGGLGRAGTIAARLLVETGVSPDEAIARVRSVRPGAIETRAQEANVKAVKPLSQQQLQQQPSEDLAAVGSRAAAAMLGLAMGDAVGTTLEFSSRKSKPVLFDMVGGGPFRLQAGEWTDDTSMSLALVDSLLTGAIDEQDMLARFYDWYRNGAYSCTGECFDIGITTRNALIHWNASKDPHSGPTAPNTAGNGSLMRLAPVAVRYWNDRDKLRDAAARQSRTTHGAPEAVDACVAYAEILADAIAGKPVAQVLAPRGGQWAGDVGRVLAGSWRGMSRRDVRSSGYVIHSLEASLWAVGRATGFEQAVLYAANLGDDADTTAAITGQLAGAIYGIEGLPDGWLDKLAWRDQIFAKASALFKASIE